MNRWT